MVCRNCGADLKPGIKYCLECGNYIDDDEYGITDSDAGTMSGGGKSYRLRAENTRPAKRKKKIKTVDLLIYAGLSIIIIVSLIIIVSSIISGNREEVISEPKVDTGDIIVNLNNYEITIPRALNYDIQGNILFVSDGANYTFSYKNTDDDFNAYASDLNKLGNELTENNYEVISIDKQTVNGRDFIISQIRVNGRLKYLYLTPLSNATSMGVIEVYESGNWENALGVISTINNNIVYDGVRDNTYGNNTEEVTTETTEKSESTDDSSGSSLINKDTDDMVNNSTSGQLG